MNGFRLLDHTADVGIEATGADLKEAFANAAKGMFSIMGDLDSVREVESREISVTGPDKESLLVAWLNELIYVAETEGLLFHRFDVRTLTDTELRAVCRGEKIDPDRHEVTAGVKAATYHQVHVDDRDGGYVSVILDV